MSRIHRYTALASATALATLGVGLALAGGAVSAPTHTKYPIEVTVDWQMSTVPNIPVNTPEANGPFLYPQTRLSGLPTAGCTPVAIQQDVYTLRNKSDADYLAGLTTLSSSADDARLSPHNYFAEVLQDASACQTDTPTPTPTPTSTVPTSTAPVSSSSSTTTTAPPSSSHTTTTVHSRTTSSGPGSSSAIGTAVSVHRDVTPRKLSASPAAHLANTGTNSEALLIMTFAAVGAIVVGIALQRRFGRNTGSHTGRRG